MLSLCLHLFTLLLIVQNAKTDILVIPYDGRFVEEEFRDLPAAFGNGLPYEGLHGMLLYAEPRDACHNLTKAPSPFKENNTGKWIILIARYNCSFEIKVRMAQSAGYDGVIIHNVGSDILEPMVAKNSSGIHIPSVFVSESTGMILKEVYAGNPDYFLIINSEIPFNINTHLLLPFAIVVGLCFLVMVVFMVAKCIRDRRRQRRDRLSSSALNKIPTCKFQKGDPYETCAICLDDYIEGEKLRVLPCAHAYHSKCIDPWLTKNRRVCPVCKRRVFAHDETPYSDTDSDTDTDDTTPLLNSNQRITQGGTFTGAERSGAFGRALRSISQLDSGSFVSASDHHSINGEIGEDSSTSSSSTTTSDDVETRPGTSSNPNRVLIV